MFLGQLANIVTTATQFVKAAAPTLKAIASSVQQALPTFTSTEGLREVLETVILDATSAFPPSVQTTLTNAALSSGPVQALFGAQQGFDQAHNIVTTLANGDASVALSLIASAALPGVDADALIAGIQSFENPADAVTLASEYLGLNHTADNRDHTLSSSAANAQIEFTAEQLDIIASLKATISRTAGDVSQARDIVAQTLAALDEAGLSEQQRVYITQELKAAAQNHRSDSSEGSAVVPNGFKAIASSTVVNEGSHVSENAAVVNEPSEAGPQEASAVTVLADLATGHPAKLISAFAQRLGLKNLDPILQALIADVTDGMATDDQKGASAINLGTDVIKNIQKVISGEQITKDALTDTLFAVQNAIGGESIMEGKNITQVFDAYQAQISTGAGESAELQKLKADNAKLQAENEELRSSEGVDRTLVVNEHTNLLQDVHSLSENVVRTLTNEINKSDTVANFIFGMTMQGKEYTDAATGEKMKVPDPSDIGALENYLRGQLLGKNSEGFTKALAHQLSFMRGDTGVAKPSAVAYGLEGIQKKAFQTVNASLWISKWIPKQVIGAFGKLKLAAPVISGFLTRIPGIGGMLNFGFLMFNEYIVNNLTFHQNSLQLMTDIAGKYSKTPPKTEQSAPRPATAAAASSTRKVQPVAAPATAA